MNIAQLERDLAAKQEAAKSLFAKTTQECQAHEVKDKDGKVLSTGREMSADEKKAIQALIDDNTVLKGRIDRAKGDEAMSAEIEKMTAGMAKKDGTRATVDRRSLGQQFVEDKDIRSFIARGDHRRNGVAWGSPSVEGMRATTVDEGSGSGGPLLITQYLPGIVPLKFKRLVIRDLLAKGTTDSLSITYMKETTFTNAGAAVGEGSPKPESTLIFTTVTDNVRKLAHWLPATEEMLEDFAQIRSYIDARLILGLDLVEEDQLLNGNGTAPNIQGILQRVGLTAAEVRSGSVTNAEVIFTEMMKVFNASFVMPTGTVMNPLNWQTTQLSKDGQGRYYGSGPFGGPEAPTLWGLPVVVTPSIVAGTGLTGAFDSAAQMFEHGGIRVEASNSHADFFVRNLIAIRAEERLALAVYRPGAFGTATSLT